MENRKIPKYLNLLYLLRGVGIFVITLVLKTVTNVQVIAISADEDLFRGQVPLILFFIVAAIGVYLIYGSITYILTLYDSDAAARFFAESRRKVQFFDEASRIVRSREFLLETGAAVLISAIGGMLGAFFETERIFVAIGVGEPALAILFTELITLPVLIFISIFQRYEVRRYWLSLKNIGDTEKLRSPLRMTLHFLLLLLYPLVYPYALFPVFVVMTFAGIATVFTQAFGIVGICVFVLALLVPLIAIPFLKRRRAKIKFMKKLAEKAEENGYILTTYTSEKGLERGPHFSLEKDGKVFYVRFIDTLRRGTPMYFTSGSEGYFLHRIGTKKHHVSLHHRFEYGFDISGDGDKLLVVIRYPKRVYASENGADRPLVGGDRIWGYTVFEPETLIGHVDRKCLGRYRGMFD